MTAPTIAEIDTILDLKDGWDGYRGRPISPATIAKAIDYAKALNLARTSGMPCRAVTGASSSSSTQMALI
jgi:hypothetical protein